MVFSSAIFLNLFLPIVLAVYFLLPSKLSVRNVWLLSASYVFYAWGNWVYIPLLLGSTLVDYFCANQIDKASDQKRRSCFMWLSVIANIGVLLWFKYLGLFATTYQYLIGGVDASILDWARSIALPVGISFYTFQSMSYTIDVYRRNVKPCRDFLTFATYVSLFPQLVAGPIVRYQEIAKQLKERRSSQSMIALGISIFVIGLSKKVLLANPCGWVADQAFDAALLDAGAAWLGLLAYSMQIYFDFSGYSEMAIGLGCMLGFTFPKNFQTPYLSSSLTDFWRRWHITLGAWLRDYIYIPLGGNQVGWLKGGLIIMAVMLIAGLWHGAMWSFVLWGGMHGVFLVIERFTGWHKEVQSRTVKALKIALTFLIVQLLWVLFRADSIELAMLYYVSLFDFSMSYSSSSALLIMRDGVYFLLGVAVMVVIVEKTLKARLLKPSVPMSLAIIGLFLLSLVVLSEQAHNPFIYFQF